MDALMPDTTHTESFEKKYAEFCKINELEETNCESLKLMVAQALNAGAAASSLNTAICSMLPRLKIKDGWKVRTMVSALHATANDVNPRTYVPTVDKCRALVSSIKDVEVQAFAFMCCATGARAISIGRLKRDQFILSKRTLTIQRRLSKTCRSRSQRDVLVFPFSWSMEPPEDVRLFLEDLAVNDDFIFGGG